MVVAVFMVLALMISGVSVYADDAAKININTASAEELTQLKGVGPKYADAIVKYREDKGKFKSPEDIMNVPGIGQKTFDNNKDLIVVE
jgi:competence protein ComEA